MLSNKLIITLVIVFFIATCSKKVTAQIIYLSDISFSKDVEEGKFRTECAMLPTLRESILKASKNISSSHSKENEEYSLKVEYIDVTPHKIFFWSIRPSSNATVKASILKDGVILHTIKKSISSKASFGACDRLEKISVAEGRYIAKWVSKYI